MLTFNNQFTRDLPADAESGHRRRQISAAIYSRVEPTAVKAPYLVAYSTEVGDLLGLSEDDMNSDTFLQVFSGNALLPGMDPHATCYGGHQFGNWAGQLGDGRAINLGEVDVGQQHYMLQLKGAGETPYSRTADGLAVMRSSIREFLCSEAMHHLGVPTTRALSLVGTGEQVMRDMLYDGNAEFEPGAVVCRVSSSFVRFGHFQMLMARGEHELLERFTDHVIEREFPSITDTTIAERSISLFNEVCTRTAKMIVEWMRVGFVHGVMNTDNMSILGETIDYGPYGWLDDFDPDWTPNTTDAQNRRYRYGQQPGIAQWNLMQLANALHPLIGATEPLEQALTEYAKIYEQHWQAMMAAKLGLNRFDEKLNNGLIKLLTTIETDMTLFFRKLADVDLEAADPGAELGEAFYVDAQVTPHYQTALNTWLSEYQASLDDQQVTERAETMNRVNPKYVLRNYLAQQAIDAAHANDFSQVQRLLEVMRKPYDDQPEHEDLAGKRPDWARTKVGCSMLSCSS